MKEITRRNFVPRGWLEKLKDGRRTRKSDEEIRAAENNLDCVGKTWILERTFRCRLFVRSLSRQRRFLHSCHNCPDNLVVALSRTFRPVYECDQWTAQMPFRIVSEYCASNRPPRITLTASRGLVPRSPGTRRSINRKFEFSPNEYRVRRLLLSTYSCVNVRSSGDSPLVSLRQMRDYHWTFEDRASSRH